MKTVRITRMNPTKFIGYFTKYNNISVGDKCLNYSLQVSPSLEKTGWQLFQHSQFNRSAERRSFWTTSAKASLPAFSTGNTYVLCMEFETRTWFSCSEINIRKSSRHRYCCFQKRDLLDARITFDLLKMKHNVERPSRTRSVIYEGDSPEPLSLD